MKTFVILQQMFDQDAKNTNARVVSPKIGAYFQKAIPYIIKIDFS